MLTRRSLVLCATVAAGLSNHAVQAQVFTSLDSFAGTNGADPTGILVQATDGNLYGTAGSGGTNDSGVVFKIATDGALTILYNFCSQTACADGANPTTGLVQAANGNFYGTTYAGGANGAGTVYQISAAGVLRTLYSFCLLTNCADGQSPQGALVQATNGQLYGTTGRGGASGDGSVFKLTTSGTLTTLHSFSGTDGANPFGVIQAANGNFYGATFGGGSYSLGTVFEITPTGTLTTLHTFTGANGANPGARLVQATDGNFYGTTNRTLGTGAKGGTIFRITPRGVLTTLYRFCSQTGCTDGNVPSALVQAGNGDFFGITNQGGSKGYGTLFEVDDTGTLTTLYSFCAAAGCADGASPFAGLAQDTNGLFYGSTRAGGTAADGTLFSLSVGLGPFLQTQVLSGKAGGAVKILGTNLTGATAVAFNGTPASFKVVSGSEIVATVPAGATTGIITATTPTAVLETLRNFTILP